jgi:hypothetical protein
LEHIKSRVRDGWKLGRGGRRGAGVTDVFVYLVWLVEIVSVLYIAIPIVTTAARQPFAEQLDTWADEIEVVMVLPITGEAMINQIESAQTVQELLDLPIPKTDRSLQHAIYTVHSIPGQDLEDAYITIDLQEILSKADGETEVKTKNLVSLAVITSAQRTQLKENSELMNEAIAEFRLSQTEAADESPSK